MSDDITGLFSSKVASDSDSVILQSWLVGGSLRPEQEVRLRTSCCQPSLALRLTDLAGNSVICTAGLLGRAAASHTSLLLLTINIMLWAVGNV